MPTHRSLVPAGLAAGLALATALPAAAGAHPGPHRRAHRRHAHTITVVEHAVTDTEQPAVPGGPDRAGDPLTFTNPVFNAANTRQVGHDEGFCMRLDVSTGTWECLWTTFLARGQITVQGPYYDTRDSVLSITGGTGAYRNARGQMKLVALDGGKEYDFVFHLS
jgi:allene oxide cyclase